MNPSNPRKQSFTYYNRSYRPDILSPLKIRQKYVLKYEGGVSILIFFEDGFVNKYVAPTIDGVGISRSESGAIMGYYTTKADSIFFTTKVFYNKVPEKYNGRVSKRGDTLFLNEKYRKKSSQTKYILYHSSG